MGKHKSMKLEDINILNINQRIINELTHSNMSSKVKFYIDCSFFYEDSSNVKFHVTEWLKKTPHRSCELYIKYDNGIVVVCRCFYEDEYARAGSKPYWDVFITSFKES